MLQYIIVLSSFSTAVDEQNTDTVLYDKELVERGYHSKTDADLSDAGLNPLPIIEIVSPEDEDEEDEEIIAITTNGSTTIETTKPISPMACLTVPMSTWSSDNDSCGLPSPMTLSPISDDPNLRRWCKYLLIAVFRQVCCISNFIFF